jgi:hypothetical protein
MVALSIAALVLASCATTNAVHLISVDQLPPDLYGRHPQAASSRTQQAIVYFIRGNRLATVLRTGSSSLSGAQLVMRQLLDGPSAEDQADGLSTAIPSDTALLGITVANHVAAVNLSQEFQRPGNTVTFQFRLAQIVYSLTELSDVDAVRFSFEGEPSAVIDQDGNPINGIVSRGKYARFRPFDEPATQVDPCSLVESLGTCPGSSGVTPP